MNRGGVLSLGLALCCLAAVANAEEPRFRFQRGETLSYRLVQTTTIAETVLDEKTEKPIETATTTKLDLIRKWKVTEVDAAGVATLEMSIVSMRLERESGNEKDVFDSSRPDDLNRNEMARHIGPVLAVLRIDSLGKVVEVKESKVGPAHRFECDLPFKLVMTGKAMKPGEAWERATTLQLDPPLGTGEKYPLKQVYTMREAMGPLLPVEMRTQISDLPPQAAEQIPMLPSLTEGTLYFDTKSGRYHAARLTVQRVLKNHQGEGSSYRYSSRYVEDYVEP